MDPLRNSTQTSYDTVAEEYAKRIFDELKDKPLDRQLLDRLAASAGPLGPICDLGCGPGQVARYLHDHGATALGVDLSPKMVAAAQGLNPAIPFFQGDMLALDVPDASWGGIAAFYSLIHIPRAQMAAALAELKRVLRPGGLLLFSFHTGEPDKHLEEWWDRPVAVDFYFFQAEEMEGYLKAAGFAQIETIERLPYPDVEYQSRRIYIFARKPV